MAISAALNTAVSGLRTTQSAVDLVANNIANADNPAYTRKTARIETTLKGFEAQGVRFVGVDRSYSDQVAKQLRNEASDLSQINTLDDYYKQLDLMFGQPGAVSSFDSIMNEFTASIEALSATPESLTSQADLINKAKILTQSLNSYTDQIQLLRENAEQEMVNAVEEANRSLAEIAEISTALTSTSRNGQLSPDFLDQRDQEINKLAEIMDINIIERENGQVAIYTKTGLSLLDGTRSEIVFSATGSLSANALYDSDPSQSALSSIVLRDQAGFSTDLISGNHLRSGQLSALVTLRDEALVQTQTKLDEFAEKLALSVSNRAVEGTVLPAPVLGSDGYEIDLAGIQPGNKISLTYEDIPGSTTSQITLVHVTNPSALPLDNSLTADPNDTVIGADLTDAADISARLAAAGFALSANAGAGSVMQFLDDGAGGTTNVTDLSASISVSGTQSGDVAFALFTDGTGPGSLYTANVNDGDSRLGLAGRLRVNTSIEANTSLLVAYSPTTAVSDSSRPDFLRQRISFDSYQFDPDTGIGSTGTPYNTTLGNFVREIVNRTAAESASIEQNKAGKEIVFNGLLSRQNEISAVNIDEEIAQLTQLQSSYAANARVLTVAQELIDILLQI
jgi:flagellar hook-associated protein 1 FlgK